MRPIILFTLVLKMTVGAMTLFDEPYLLVGVTGGTNNAGLTIAMYLYDRGFQVRPFWLRIGHGVCGFSDHRGRVGPKYRFFGRSNTRRLEQTMASSETTSLTESRKAASVAVNARHAGSRAA